MQANVNNPSMETPASVNSGVYQTAPSGGCWKNVMLRSDQLTDATRVSQQDSHTMMTDCGVRGLRKKICSLFSSWWNCHWQDVGYFLQEIQDHRQFVDFSSYNNHPAIHLILLVHNCGHSDNFSSLLWAPCSVGLLGSLIQHMLVALGAFHAVCADDAGGPMEVEHHDELLSLGFQLLDLRLQLRVQHLQPFGFLRGPTKNEFG